MEKSAANATTTFYFSYNWPVYLEHNQTFANCFNETFYR